MFDLIIRNVFLNGSVTDIGICGGKISSIGNLQGECAAEVFEAASRFAATPAFYNTHTHAAMTLLRGFAEDMELFEWLNEHIWPVEASLTPEEIYTGSKLAAIEMKTANSGFIGLIITDVITPISATPIIVNIIHLNQT